MKILSESKLDRTNILNNQLAVVEIEKAIGIKGVEFEDSYRFTKKQIARFFEVDERTIERYIENNKSELEENGYDILRANRLKKFKLAMNKLFGSDIDVGTKISILGIFDFRAFLNIGMLLTESEVAKELRSTILDIVIDTINAKTGGGTKYINQRDKDFVVTYFKNENYRKAFTDALDLYVDMGKFKYPYFTDKIYKSVFREKATEYRKILKLKDKDSVRKTLYSEVLLVISSVEYGFAELLKAEFNHLGRKLIQKEASALFIIFSEQPHWKPFLDDARNKMASRDLCFREALHLQLEEYLAPLPKEEFEKFLGSSSMDVEKQLEQFEDVFKRLKERT